MNAERAERAQKIADLIVGKPAATRLRDAAEVLAELANDLERAAAHEGIVTAARGEFSAIRTCVIADNIADLRERAGHLRFLAATAFRTAE